MRSLRPCLALARNEQLRCMRSTLSPEVDLEASELSGAPAPCSHSPIASVISARLELGDIAVSQSDMGRRAELSRCLASFDVALSESVVLSESRGQIEGLSSKLTRCGALTGAASKP